MTWMNRTIALAACAALLLVSAAPADDAANVNAPSGVFRASALKGIPVRNAKTEDLGKINDLVVDKDGKIVYGVLSYGGVAGVGDKLFAVPPSQLNLGTMPGNANKPQFTVSADKSQLETSPGFNEKNYPTEPSSIFMGHDAARTTTGSRTEHADQWRVSKIIGLPVKNNAGEDLGKVNDVMVSLKNAKIVYVAVQHGGTLSGGAKYFAVPWDVMAIKPLSKPTDVNVVLDVSKATLDGAPGYDQKNWPTEPDRQMFRRK